VQICRHRRGSGPPANRTRKGRAFFALIKPRGRWRPAIRGGEARRKPRPGRGARREEQDVFSQITASATTSPANGRAVRGPRHRPVLRFQSRIFSRTSTTPARARHGADRASTTPTHPEGRLSGAGRRDRGDRARRRRAVWHAGASCSRWRDEATFLPSLRGARCARPKQPRSAGRLSGEIASSAFGSSQMTERRRHHCARGP